MANEFERLFSKISKRPTTITLISDDCIEDARRILGKDPSSLDWGEYQIMLEGNFEESLYYVPHAVRRIQNSPECLGELADSVIDFMSEYADRLVAHGVYEALIDEFRSIFFTWISRFSATTQRREKPPYDVLISASVHDSGYRDGLLNKAFETQLRYADGLLVENIVEQWSTDLTNPFRSAHWIDFCVCSRSGMGLPPKVYSHWPIASRAFDLKVFESQWKVAGETIRTQCPPEYVDLVERMLRGE